MKSKLWMSVLALLLPLTAAWATFPSPPAEYTHVAIASGGWQRADVWDVDQVPGDGAIVLIPSNVSVTVTRQESARIRFVEIQGELRMKVHSNTRLITETLHVAQGGTFTIGNLNNPVDAGLTAELVFTSSGPFDLSWDPQQLSRGFISDGKVRMYGQTTTNWVEMDNDALAGSDVIDLDTTVPTDWGVGDEIVVAGTHFRRNTGSQEEKRTIDGISGTQITLDSALTYDHIRAAGSSTPIHIANLTRNIVLRSESTAMTRDRGHVMFRNGDVDVRYVAFDGLGRTDKKIPLDDLTVTEPTPTTYDLSVPAASAVSNRRGRYSVHFHKNGTQPTATDPPSKVYGCVVTDAIGWGFVNHSSHVDFRDNVCYDFDGAAFVTEAGDELGNFFDNLAIGGRGNGEYRPIRIVFDNDDRPQPLSDFGFSGDGFWFQGPAIRARDNVANGCNGAGMIWFTTGAPDPAQLFSDQVGGDVYIHERYSHFPRSSLAAVYGSFPDFSSHLPRYWEHSVTDEKIIISDLPILECDGFTAYGNLVGFRLRFNNHGNVSWYTEDPFDFDTQIVPVIGSDITAAIRMRQEVRDLNLWNNEQGFRARYAQKTDWSDVVVANRLDYTNATAHAGGEINFQVQDTTLDNVKVDGYEVAFFVAGMDFNVYNLLTLTHQSYDNYASANVWNKGKTPSCTGPTAVTVSNITTTSATVSWTGSSIHDRYLVRYKVVGTQPWSFVDTPSTSVDLFGLTPASTYYYQVIPGCTITDSDPSTPDGTVGKYTAAATFTTN